MREVIKMAWANILKQDDKWAQLEQTDEVAAIDFMQYISHNHSNFKPQLEEMGNKNQLSVPNMVSLVGEEIANKWYTQFR